MKQTAARVIRVCTVPPVMAALLILVLHTALPDSLPAVHMWVALVFLTVLPCLAYPVCALIPKLRRGGRKTQRTAAVIFSVVGYVAGVAWSLWRGGDIERMMYFTYLFTGIAIAVCDRYFAFKASGHAGGTAGPIVMLAAAVSPWYAALVLLLAAVWWSSLTLGRHTVRQLAVGSMIPAVGLALAWLIF